MTPSSSRFSKLFYRLFVLLSFRLFNFLSFQLFILSSFRPFNILFSCLFMSFQIFIASYLYLFVYSSICLFKFIFSRLFSQKVLPLVSACACVPNCSDNIMISEQYLDLQVFVFSTLRLFVFSIFRLCNVYLIEVTRSYYQRTVS